jgi:hypothetical protein
MEWEAMWTRGLNHSSTPEASHLNKVYFSNKNLNKIKYISSLREMKHEAPKGLILGPVFLLFINDLPINIQDWRIILFAYDNKHSNSSRDLYRVHSVAWSTSLIIISRLMDFGCHTRGRTFIGLLLAVARQRATQWALALQLWAPIG